MRKIKFRVWDKQKKEWFPLKNAMCLVLNPDSTDLVFITNNGPYKIPDTGQEDGGINRFIIQQFTGLKDKNNKDIYEGSIVNHKNGTHEVIYDNEIMSFQCNLSNCVTDQESGGYKNIEIVGNIFESPELLKNGPI